MVFAFVISGVLAEICARADAAREGQKRRGTRVREGHPHLAVTNVEIRAIGGPLLLLLAGRKPPARKNHPPDSPLESASTRNKFIWSFKRECWTIEGLRLCAWV